MNLVDWLYDVDASDSNSEDVVERIKAQVAQSRRRHRQRKDLDVDKYLPKEDE